MNNYKNLNPYYEKPRKHQSNSISDSLHHPGGLANFESTIAWSILPDISFFTLISTAVCLIQDKTTYSVQLPLTLLSILGLLIAFSVSFRTSSAQERYSEGRKLWSTIILASRTFNRLAWLHVPNTMSVHTEENPITEEEIVRAIVEKKTMMNLVAGFSVALKHYLRGESGIYYKDLYPLVCFIPKYQLPTSAGVENTDRPDLPLNVSPHSSSRSGLTRRSSTSTRKIGIHQLEPTRELLPSYNPPPTYFWLKFIPFYQLWRDLFGLILKKVSKTKTVRNKKGSMHTLRVNENIPLELTFLLSSWVQALAQRKVIDPPVFTALLVPINSMTEALTGLERILMTPIPISYQIHLQHVIYVYLFLLPSQIHSAFGYLTIPATALAAFVFLGFLEIGVQIENPFGYDATDLNLDSFVHVIFKELNEITSHPPTETDPQNYVFSSSNLPFSRFSSNWTGLSATQLVEEGVLVQEVEEIHLKGKAVLDEVLTK